jgi:hypothetical protein
MQRRQIALLAFVVLLAGTALVFSGIRVFRYLHDSALRAVVKPREETVDLTTLVTRVRELNRLETAAMHVIHVSTITQSYGVVPNSIAGDELTLFAAGDVIAGIDLSQLRAADVWRDPDGVIVVRLPSPQILITRLDNRETRVISRKTGIFRRADMNLEARARQSAETGIRMEAMRKGILPLAAQNGEKKMGELLHTLGARRVRFSQTAAAPSPR